MVGAVVEEITERESQRMQRLINDFKTVTRLIVFLQSDATVSLTS